MVWKMLTSSSTALRRRRPHARRRLSGRTALGWQGVRRNVEFVERLTLWGAKPGDLPAWFTDAFPSRYRSTALFASEVGNLGIFTPAALTAGVRVSARERAVVLHSRIKEAWDPQGILNPGTVLPHW
jgi:hypothetical protein